MVVVHPLSVLSVKSVVTTGWFVIRRPRADDRDRMTVLISGFCHLTFGLWCPSFLQILRKRIQVLHEDSLVMEFF